MKAIVDLCVVPIGVGVSLSGYVAACENVLRQSKLNFALHANGTNIEGEWDAVFETVKKCHQVVHDLGAPRIFTSIKIGTSRCMIKSVASRRSSMGIRRAPPDCVWPVYRCMT